MIRSQKFKMAMASWPWNKIRLLQLPTLMTGAWEGREYGLKRRGSRDVWKMHVGWNRCFSKNYIHLALDFLNRKSWHVFPCFFLVYFSHLKMIKAKFWQHVFFRWHLGWNGWISSGRVCLRSSRCFHSFAILGYSTYVLGPLPIREWSRNWTCVTLVAFNKRVTCPYTIDN